MKETYVSICRSWRQALSTCSSLTPLMVFRLEQKVIRLERSITIIMKTPRMPPEGLFNLSYLKDGVLHALALTFLSFAISIFGPGSAKRQRRLAGLRSEPLLYGPNLTLRVWLPGARTLSHAHMTSSFSPLKDSVASCIVLWTSCAMPALEEPIVIMQRPNPSAFVTNLSHPLHFQAKRSLTLAAEVDQLFSLLKSLNAPL